MKNVGLTIRDIDRWSIGLGFGPIIGTYEGTESIFRYERKSKRAKK